MNTAIALGKSQPADIESLAFDLVQKELREIIQISTTLAKSFGFLQSRVKTQFPKTCAKCSKTYANFEEFFYETEEIVHGIVNYPIVNDDFYMHRNCREPCESTLVVVFEDRRDESLSGCRRRKIFENCLIKLEAVLKLEEGECRELLLNLLSKAIMKQNLRRAKFVS